MPDSHAAARLALMEARWDDARRHCEDLLRSQPEDPDAIEALGTALFWLDETDRSFELREQAYRLWLGRDDRRAAARVAMAIALDAVDVRGMAVCSGWLQRARTLLEDVEQSPEHGWLALWEGHLARAIEHDLEKARASALQSKAIGRELKLQDLELLAIALEGLINVTAGNVRDGMRQLDEATAAAMAGEISDIDAVLATCCFLVHACERVCDWDRAAQWGVQIDALAQRWRLGTAFAGCQAEHAAMLIGRGEWERAERDLLEAMTVLEAKRPLIVHEAIVQLAELRRRQGRIEEAIALFNRCPTATESILGLAAIAIDRGDATRAAEMLDRLRRRPMAEKWVQRAQMMEMLARAAADRGAADELRQLADSIGIDMVHGMSKCADARLAGDDVTARELYEDAVDAFERCAAPWDAARTRLELAAVLRRLGRDSFAAEEEAAARTTFRRLGVIAGDSQTPLTKREMEVLQLVAQGLSNKEVAIKLKLSEHTVHRHVSNVLTKLDSPSRAAAVARASREGWM